MVCGIPIALHRCPPRLKDPVGAIGNDPNKPVFELGTSREFVAENLRCGWDAVITIDSKARSLQRGRTLERFAASGVHYLAT